MYRVYIYIVCMYVCMYVYISVFWVHLVGVGTQFTCFTSTKVQILTRSGWW